MVSVPYSLHSGTIGRIRNPQVGKRSLNQLRQDELVIDEDPMAGNWLPRIETVWNGGSAAHINLALDRAPNEHRGAGLDFLKCWLGRQVRPPGPRPGERDRAAARRTDFHGIGDERRRLERAFVATSTSSADGTAAKIFLFSNTTVNRQLENNR